MNIILLGPPGAGKGTQAKLLQDQHDMALIATGDILRAAIKDGEPLGLEAKQIMDAGKLVPDDLMIRLIEIKIAVMDPAQGFILDGFPRTVPQAQALDEMLDLRGRKLTAVIELKTSEAALVERVAGRFSCTNCGAGYHEKFKPTKIPGICDVCGHKEFMHRPDDNAETLKTRLKTYQEQTAPILPYYRQKGLLKTVDGMRSMEEVHQEMKSVLKASKAA